MGALVLAVFTGACGNPPNLSRIGELSTNAAGQAAKDAAASGAITVTGTVRRGVESGCLVLATGSKLYGLFGGDPAELRPGAHVTVHGRPDPGGVTTCMQGVPLHVIRTSPA